MPNTLLSSLPFSRTYLLKPLEPQEGILEKPFETTPSFQQSGETSLEMLTVQLEFRYVVDDRLATW
jgi:hypothetical protein